MFNIIPHFITYMQENTLILTKSSYLILNYSYFPVESSIESKSYDFGDFLY